MAYASADDLALAVRVKLTAENAPLLASCVGAASVEIDHYLDRSDPLPEPTPDLVRQVCIARGVEWWKASDAAFGALGFDGTGVLTAPQDTFARHARNLIPYKAAFGVA